MPKATTSRAAQRMSPMSSTQKSSKSAMHYPPLEHICLHPGCGKSWQRASDLRRHEPVHLPDPERKQIKMRCQEPGCSYETIQKSNLQTHYRSVHTNQKPFSCDSCGYRTADPSGLSRHKKTRRHRLKLAGLQLAESEEIDSSSSSSSPSSPSFSPVSIPSPLPSPSSSSSSLPSPSSSYLGVTSPPSSSHPNSSRFSAPTLPLTWPMAHQLQLPFLSPDVAVYHAEADISPFDPAIFDPGLRRLGSDGMSHLLDKHSIPPFLESLLDPPALNYETAHEPQVFFPGVPVPMNDSTRDSINWNKFLDFASNGGL